MAECVLNITFELTGINTKGGLTLKQQNTFNFAQYRTGGQFLDFSVLHVMHWDIFAWLAANIFASVCHFRFLLLIAK